MPLPHPAITNSEKIKHRFGVDINKSPADPDTIHEVNQEYIALMRESLGLDHHGVAQIPAICELGPEASVVSMPLGTHRERDNKFSGTGIEFNLYPGRMTLSKEDAENAIKWAIDQQRHFPQEDNYAWRHADTHSLIVRVEWGSNPEQPYEVDTEPAGYGLLAHFSPKVRQAFLAHRRNMGGLLWNVTPEANVDNLFEHTTVPYASFESLNGHADNSSGLILPFFVARGALEHHWRRRSILPVEQKEDKTHLIDMGLFEHLRHDDDAAFERLQAELADGKPKVLRGLAGSCAVGLVIFKGSGEQGLKVGDKKLLGTVTQTKFLNAIRTYRERRESCMIRDFAPATTLQDLGIKLTVADRDRFGHPGHMCAIKRVYVGFDASGKPHVLGGIITARPRTTLIHGANDSINVILDPPEDEEYAQAA